MKVLIFILLTVIVASQQN